MLDMHVQLSYKSDTHRAKEQSKVLGRLFQFSLRHSPLQGVQLEVTAWEGCIQDHRNRSMQCSKVNKYTSIQEKSLIFGLCGCIASHTKLGSFKQKNPIIL